MHNDAYPDDVRPFPPAPRYSVHYKSTWEVVDSSNGTVKASYGFDPNNGLSRQVANIQASRHADRLNGEH